MIKVRFLGEWHTLATLNGYYRLEDLKGPSPADFLATQGPHTMYTIQCKRFIWASQPKVYQYCAWADPEFKAAMEAALESGDMSLAPATGVIHV